jgi:iron complex transport system substrate-binding protein
MTKRTSWAVGIAFLAFCGIVSAHAAGPPERIVSTNVCTDQLLLLLVERERIAALSNLSTDPTLSTMAETARGIPQTGGRAEEIVPLKPDLVLANAWTGAKASRFLKGLGIKVLVVPEAKSLEEIGDVVAMLGDALIASERAAQIVSDMRSRIANLRRAPSRRMALVYEPNGYTPSTGTLTDSVLMASGWTNLAPTLGVRSYGAVPLERVVLTQPDLLVFDDHAPSNASRAQGLLHHPALKTVAGKAKIEWMPSRLWICAGPWTIDAVQRLAKIERRS